MANNGRIEYTPYPARAIAPEGTYYLSLAEETNLIGVNPGAETGDLTGWKTGTGASVINTDHYEGSYCFKIFASPGYNLHSEKSVNPFNLNRGQRYKLLFAAKHPDGPVDQGVWIYDGNGIVIDSFFIPITDTWKVHSYNFQAKSNYLDCHIKFDMSLGIQGTYIDKVIITTDYVDFGLNSFSADWLFRPFTQAGDRAIVNKYANNKGWSLYYNGTDKKYKFTIGDGTTTLAAQEFGVCSQITDQEWHWGRLEVDRDTDLATLYINNSQLGNSIDISTITGNLSNSQPLCLCGYTTPGLEVSGNLDFIRLRRGTPLDATWRAAEWGRIQAGAKRFSTSADVLWDFNDNLIDTAQGLTLTPNTGTPAYTDGWPYGEAPVSYTFDQNFSYGESQNYLDMHNPFRSAVTNAAFINPGVPKRELILSFEGINEAQMAYLKAAYEGGSPIAVWLDSDQDKIGDFYCSRSPQQTSIPYFGDAGEQLYEGNFELTEV